MDCIHWNPKVLDYILFYPFLLLWHLVSSFSRHSPPYIVKYFVLWSLIQNFHYSICLIVYWIWICWLYMTYNYNLYSTIICLPVKKTASKYLWGYQFLSGTSQYTYLQFAYCYWIITNCDLSYATVISHIVFCVHVSPIQYNLIAVNSDAKYSRVVICHNL